MHEKQCRKCGQTKPIVDFHTHSRMADGHLNACKACQNAYTKERNKLRDPEAERDRQAAWRAANPDRWKEIRDRAQENSRTNGTAGRSAVARRARKSVATVAPVSINGVIADHGMHCSICDKPIADRRQLTVDHIIPLARGGRHAAENLRPAHRACNSWKCDRLPLELTGLSTPSPGEVDEWEERRRAKANAIRGDAHRKWWAEATPEQKAARNAKVSASNRGHKKRQFLTPEQRAAHDERRIAAAQTPEAQAKRAASNVSTWANKTPEEREAWKGRCREVKRGAPGNAANLSKGWSPEVRAKALEKSADLRRGKPVSDEQKQKTSESLKRAYAEGPRGRGHTEETKRKISETKRNKSKQ